MCRHREVDMDWWWIPIGLAAWVVIGTAVALWLGQFLRSGSHARDALDKHTGEHLRPAPIAARHRRHAS
ncbi:MAG: hypothetical protein JO217_10760 [Acidobacteriaceae bacterium]|nr:hypothetical protein [Acidobacteriaceae bacterium]